MTHLGIREFGLWLPALSCALAWFALTFLIGDASNGGGMVSLNYQGTLQAAYFIGMALLGFLTLLSFRFSPLKWALLALNLAWLAFVLFMTVKFRGYREINIPFILSMTLGIVFSHFNRS